jgi:TPR repeat protein
MLSSGHGVKKDQQRADKILREVFGALRLLSDQRDGLATAILGVYSELGLSNVSLDIVEAEKLYRESLSQGHDYGLVGLAKILLLKGEPESREGRGLLHDACSKGSSPALRALLDEKLDRSGDWSGWKKGEPTEETILLVNKLAALSDTSALRALHDISMSGDGKYKDDARAFKISGLLREKGEDVDYEQARHYMNGTGVLKNYQLGFKLAMKSAMNGNRGSCTLLSWAYHHGHGVPKSYVSAYAWALIAAAKCRIAKDCCVPGGGNCAQSEKSNRSIGVSEQ